MTIEIVDDNVAAGGAIYCCRLHKDVPPVAVCGDNDLAALGIKVLHYCPVPGCRSFQCDDGNETWDGFYTKFGVNTLPYIVPTREQRTLQHIFRQVFIQAVRIAILMDKRERGLPS